MKTSKFIFLFLFFLTLSQIFYGQEKSEPNLIASINGSGCEHINQYVDELIYELEKNPASTGYIVISQEPKKPKELNLRPFIYQDFMSVHIKQRKIDQSRLKFIRSNGSKFKVDFFLMPIGAVAPNFNEAIWDLSIPSKPGFFAEENGIQLCDETPLQLNAFSEFLNANPNSGGRFIVHAESLKDFRKEKARLTIEIKKAHISPIRIKFIYKKDKYVLPDHSYSYLWLIPKSKNNLGH